MKKISIEEAKEYIPCMEDYLDDPPFYYTLKDAGNGWDEVSYYTNKKKGLFIGKEGDEWVYILTNSVIPGIVKIGYTRLDPFDRALQVSRGTGVPIGYDVEWAYKCYKGERIEREVHKYFKKFRISPNREFFRVSIEEAKVIIKQIGEKYI
jgi:hypothetical protein